MKKEKKPLEPYFNLPAGMIHRLPQLSPAALRIYLVLHSCLNRKSGRLYPGRKALGHYTGLSRDRIRVGVAELQEAGLIERLRRDGTGGNTYYRLIPLDREGRPIELPLGKDRVRPEYLANWHWFEEQRAAYGERRGNARGADGQAEPPAAAASTPGADPCSPDGLEDEHRGAGEPAPIKPEELNHKPNREQKEKTQPPRPPLRGAGPDGVPFFLSAPERIDDAAGSTRIDRSVTGSQPVEMSVAQAANQPVDHPVAQPVEEDASQASSPEPEPANLTWLTTLPLTASDYIALLEFDPSDWEERGRLREEDVVELEDWVGQYLTIDQVDLFLSRTEVTRAVRVVENHDPLNDSGRSREYSKNETRAVYRFRDEDSVLDDPSAAAMLNGLFEALSSDRRRFCGLVQHALACRWYLPSTLVGGSIEMSPEQERADLDSKWLRADQVVDLAVAASPALRQMLEEIKTELCRRELKAAMLSRRDIKDLLPGVLARGLTNQYLCLLRFAVHHDPPVRDKIKVYKHRLAQGWIHGPAIEQVALS